MFANFANNITQRVNQLEENINDTIENVNRDINITIDNVSRDLNLNAEEEYQAVLADLRNNRSAGGINPEDIKDMTDEQALKFIRSRGVTNFLEDIPPQGTPVPVGSPPPVEDLPERTPEVVESFQEEETQEILEDPQIAGIFSDLRTEFPEPTPTPNVRLEGFEDVPLTTAVRVNKHLKQQFMENFKF